MKNKIKKWHIALMSFLALFVTIFASLFSLRADTIDEETGEVVTDNWELGMVFYDSTVNGGTTQLSAINWNAITTESRTITIQVNYKNTENRDKAIEEYILNTTHEFYGSKKADRNLEKFINELYGNAMKHFRKEIKLPSEDHYRLVCLLLAGVSINFISSLSGETTNAIYKRREKIREIIKNSDSPNKELYLLI